MIKRLDLKLFFASIAANILLMVIGCRAEITNYSKNDPFPIFSTLDPEQLFLYTYHCMELKGLATDRKRQEWFNLSISPFGQNANDGKNSFNVITPLGDLNGRWGMVPLLFGPTPQGKVFPPALVTAQSVLFPTVPMGTPIDDPASVDPGQNLGYFSIPMEYRKRGLRFDFSAQILCDFGLNLKVGLADIRQTAQFVNLTCNATAPCSTTACSLTTACINPNNPALTGANVNTYLMNTCVLNEIANQINWSLDNFCKFSAEDIRLGAYWRHAFPINPGGSTEDCFCCPTFLLIPYAQLQGSFAVGYVRQYNHPFALSFGNNSHNALGATAGINLDFTDTIEIGMEASATHFFERGFCNVPVPTHPCQSGIYPFQTDVNIQPGNNYEFAAKMFAYHFVECLNFHFQYVLIRHECDCFRLQCPDPAFLPHLLEKRSCWTAQVANIGLNYDISPHISLGFLWQAPISQRNTYRSTTVMFGFNATY